MGFDLSGQRHNAVIFSLVFHDAGQRAFNIRIFNQQTHAAGKLSLDGTGRRRNAVFHIVLQKKIPKGQALIIVDKQNIPAKIRISH